MPTPMKYLSVRQDGERFYSRDTGEKIYRTRVIRVPDGDIEMAEAARGEFVLAMATLGIMPEFDSE